MFFLFVCFKSNVTFPFPRRPLSQYLIFSKSVSRSHRFLDSAVFVRNKVFGSESSAIADVYYSLMCDHSECEYGALVGGECGSSD